MTLRSPNHQEAVSRVVTYYVPAQKVPQPTKTAVAFPLHMFRAKWQRQYLSEGTRTLELTDETLRDLLLSLPNVPKEGDDSLGQVTRATSSHALCAKLTDPLLHAFP